MNSPDIGMLDTLEVRWFWRMPPIDRPRLFGRSVPAERIDWYSRCNDANGIKLREGNLDVKVLVEEFGPREFAGSIGVLQRWVKATYRSDDSHAGLESAIEEAGWLAVTKSRSLLVFDVDAGEARVTEGWCENGCQFEWTVVVHNDESWLTVGLEAWGDPDSRLQSLAASARFTLAALPPSLQLDEAHSCSYPGWLNQVAGRS